MSKQIIQLGTEPSGIGGDTERSAFTKCNANFTELYEGIAQAVIEKGTNARGSWVKFSDGTMIQSFVPWVSATATANQILIVEYDLPTTCVGFSTSSVIASAIPSASNDHYGVTSSQVISATRIYLTIRNGAVAQNFSMRCNVITRWK